MQRFWFLCVAMMVLGGCVADTRDLHMDGGIPTPDAMVLTDDSATVTPDDAGATDGDEGWSDEDFRRASDACFNLYTAIYCQEFPNEEFESENDLALHCDALVLTEAVPDCLDEFITSYECGNLSVQEIQSCEDRPNRAWETDCDYDKITECRSHMDGGNDDGSIVEPRYVALVPMEADWQQAGDACARLGGHLPEPSTPEAQAALVGFVVATGIDQHFWIGLTRDLMGEYEQWSFSGETLSFTNWEETNPSYGPEACVEFRVTDRFTWNDLPCDAMLTGNIVCEMP